MQLVAIALLALAPLAKAQEAIKVAVCNPGKVFESLDERKAIQDKMKGERDRVQSEAKRRDEEVKQLKLEREALKPESPQYAEKTQLLMQKAVEFEVWARIQEQEMAKREKDQVKALYDKIAAACKVVAEQKKLDLILSERKPEIPPDMSQLTPDQLRALLAQTDVLYKNEKADVTQAVIGQLNADYAKGTSTPK
jgi:Skp family chaperone for outer membrane proteins